MKAAVAIPEITEFDVEGNLQIYDSAVLIDCEGELALHYRRMSPGWCSRKANPAEYGYGSVYTTAQTPFGKVGFLICGDLFQVEQSAVEAELDLLLFPFARCFSSKVSEPQREWNVIEWPEYAKQISKVNAAALMANYIAPAGSPSGGGFGGGFITDKNAERLASLPLHQPGLLICDIDLR